MTAVLIIVTIVAVLVAGFASAMAKAFEVSSLARLEELAIARDKRATFDAILAGEERAALAAESIRVLFTVIAVSCLTWWLSRAWKEPLAPADLLVGARFAALGAHPVPNPSRGRKRPRDPRGNGRLRRLLRGRLLRLKALPLAHRDLLNGPSRQLERVSSLT